MTRSTPGTVRLVGLLTPLLLAAGLTGLAGCDSSAEDPEPSSGATSTSPDEPSTEVTSQPPSSPAESSATPTSATPTSATPTPPKASPSASQAPVVDQLLPAEELPGFNNEWFWSEGRTTASEPRRLAATCHRFPMTSIGATEVAFRTYRPPAGGNAGAQQLVADFADKKTAWRAYQTVLSWRAGCPKQLRTYPRVDVSLFSEVAVDQGEAGWWIAMYGPIGDDPDVAAFDTEGVTLVGDRVSIVRMVLYGQDYNYASGKEPIALAVRRAADRLP